MRQLKDKTAIVTGSGAGIGKEIAVQYAREGADVAVVDINMDAAEETARELTELGVSARAYKEDLSEAKVFTGLIDKIEQELGGIDILVNNAGLSFTTKIADMDIETWELVMGVNARGTFFMSQAVFAKMMERGQGRIINIASISGDRPAKFSDAAYCASKAAVLMITKVYAKAATGTGITVNSISPGMIETELSLRLGSSISPEDVPLARMGTVTEVADAAVFLASGRARYITGQNIRVNGGAFMG